LVDSDDKQCIIGKTGLTDTLGLGLGLDCLVCHITEDIIGRCESCKSIVIVIVTGNEELEKGGQDIT
jgi:hypothetical protein